MGFRDARRVVMGWSNMAKGFSWDLTPRRRGGSGTGQA